MGIDQAINWAAVFYSFGNKMLNAGLISNIYAGPSGARKG